MVERIFPDRRHALGNRDARQAGAQSECRDSDAGDTVGDCNTGRTSVSAEGPLSDAGDRQANDRAGDVHRTAGAGISGDGDCAIIGRVNVLGLRRTRQRQQQQQQDEPRGARCHDGRGESELPAFHTH